MNIDNNCLVLIFRNEALHLIFGMQAFVRYLLQLLFLSLASRLAWRIFGTDESLVMRSFVKQSFVKMSSVSHLAYVLFRMSPL
jgi:hypothetical protein